MDEFEKTKYAIYSRQAMVIAYLVGIIMGAVAVYWLEWTGVIH